MTAVIRREHDLRNQTLPVVRDVEEVTHVIKQPLLALRDGDLFPHDHHPVALRAAGRPVLELRHLLGDQPLVLVTLLTYYLFFYVIRSIPRPSLDHVTRGAIQLFPG